MEIKYKEEKFIESISELCENISNFSNLKNSSNSNLSELSSLCDSPRSKDIFLSHSWDLDILNRDNHQRVKNLSNILTSNGFSVWFDENEINYGNIDMCMINGIQNSKCFVVCITQSYINKLNHKLNNCFKEFNYANILQKPLVPILMEPIENLEKLPGLLNFYIGNQLYYNLSIKFSRTEIKKIIAYFKFLNIEQQKNISFNKNYKSDILSKRKILTKIYI